MSEIFVTTVGDTGRRIRFRVYEPPTATAAAVPMDLTGRTVKLYAGKDGVRLLDGVTCTPEDQTADETKGYAYYDPPSDKVATAGAYDVKVKVFTGSDPISIPAQGFHRLLITKDLP